MARRRGSRDDREFLYGRNPVDEALKGKRRVYRLWVREGRQEQARLANLRQRAHERGVEIRETAPRHLDDLSQGGNHQGVVLETGRFPYVSLEDILERAGGRLVLVLDHLQDPQNLATMIRTAAALDVAGLIIQSDRSASITPAVVRSSAGLVEHMDVARERNTRDAVERLKSAGYWAIALESADGSVSIYDAEVPTPTALVVGSEDRGISRTVLGACDLTISLPMPGPVESLNAAVAGSVAMFELYRRGLKAANRER